MMTRKNIPPKPSFINKGRGKIKAVPFFFPIPTNVGKKGDKGDFLHFCKVIFILLLATLVACSPDRFALNENEGITVYGLIMSGLETAGKPDKYTNALHLRQNARIALAASYLTQFEARFTVEMIEGNGIKFSMRTIADNFASHPRIQFLYDTFGSTIYENDMKINSVDSIKLSAMEKKLIRISNYGDYYTITVDCDTVYTGRTKLPATEYVIIETLDSTELFISGIKFAEIYETRTIYE